MNNAFHQLHMPPQLACDLLAVFSRMEYALKSTIRFASGNDKGVEAAWDVFAKDIDEKFGAINDTSFLDAVKYLLTSPPRKQVIRDGVLRFEDQAIDTQQPKAQQVLLLVRRVRNNLFHGGKHLPDGEVETGRNATLVRHALTVLTHCIALDPDVRARYEH